jgi:multiple sugar transport system ATP-binding protein
VMFEGSIRQVATPDELHRNPVDIDVARFMTQPFLNTLSARCVMSGRVAVRDETMVVDDAREPGRDGLLGFRPSATRLSARRVGGSLAGQVERIEHQGSEALVFIRLQSTDDQCVARIPSSELEAWPVGASCWMTFDPAQTWFFPRTPGSSLPVQYSGAA